MRQSVTRLLTVFSFLSFFVFSTQVHASGAKRPDLAAEAAQEMGTDGSANIQTANASAYTHIDTNKEVPATLLQKAINYFDANKSKIKNQDYMVVIDYSKKSTNERFFLIDMVSGKVEKYLVAHGAGSDPDADGVATKFSNTDSTHMTSLGFFITAETYFGGHGYSLMLDGQSSTNSNARARSIVIHGAEYVNPGSVGRSWGCPALSMREYEDVISKIKGGALIYSAS
jgi:hypothetical protein